MSEVSVSKEKYNLDIKALAKLLYKGRVFLVLITLSGFLISLVATMPNFYPPEYLSEAIIYPAHENTNSSMILSDMKFGGDKEIDEQIQILKSTIVRDSIVKKFKLLKHYRIDPEETSALKQLYKTYDNNISIDQTRYNSISIQVYDTDPKTAAAIAGEIVKTGDRVKSEVIRKNLRNAFLSTEAELKNKMNELAELANVIHQRQQEIETKYNNNLTLYNKEFPDFNLETYKAKYKSEMDLLKDIKFKYETGKANLSYQVPASYLVSPPDVPVSKARPKRTLLILLSSVTSLLVGIFILAGIDRVSLMLKEIRN